MQISAAAATITENTNQTANNSEDDWEDTIINIDRPQRRRWR